MFECRSDELSTKNRPSQEIYVVWAQRNLKLVHIGHLCGNIGFINVVSGLFTNHQIPIKYFLISGHHQKEDRLHYDFVCKLGRLSRLEIIVT